MCRAHLIGLRITAHVHRRILANYTALFFCYLIYYIFIFFFLFSTEFSSSSIVFYYFYWQIPFVHFAPFFIRIKHGKKFEIRSINE
jgi:hypothetical protein